MVANLKPLFGLVIFIAAGRLEKAMTVRPIDFDKLHRSYFLAMAEPHTFASLKTHTCTRAHTRALRYEKFPNSRL